PRALKEKKGRGQILLAGNLSASPFLVFLSEICPRPLFLSPFSCPEICPRPLFLSSSTRPGAIGKSCRARPKCGRQKTNPEAHCNRGPTIALVAPPPEGAGDCCALNSATTARTALMIFPPPS